MTKAAWEMDDLGWRLVQIEGLLIHLTAAQKYCGEPRAQSHLEAAMRELEASRDAIEMRMGHLGGFGERLSSVVPRT